MAVFTVQISIADTQRKEWIDLSATVDTGAYISSVPGSILRHLGIPPTMRNTVRLANGNRKTIDIAYTWLRLDGRQIMTYIAFNDETSNPLLGALTLKELWLCAAPKEGRLYPLTNTPL